MKKVISDPIPKKVVNVSDARDHLYYGIVSKDSGFRGFVVRENYHAGRYCAVCLYRSTMGNHFIIGNDPFYDTIQELVGDFVSHSDVFDVYEFESQGELARWLAKEK